MVVRSDCDVMLMTAVVSKAFQVLSDPDKRAAYDANPKADPETRFRAAPTFNGRQFDGEVSPEELFNMFFGGGVPVNGGSFGGSPFGGPSEYLARPALHEMLICM